MRKCLARDLGRIAFEEAFDLQQRLAALRKEGRIPDQLLFVEHPHVITMGRNAHASNLLVDEQLLAGQGVALHHTNRGGDVTYHGPGQVVVYPIFDLREWKRDVVAYVRALEEVVIAALGDFSIAADRLEGCTGVWTGGAKICAIGVHLSRWVSSHGLALNVSTDLSYFRYIVPCGLAKPVTSMRELGAAAFKEEVIVRLAAHFGRVFDLDVKWTTRDDDRAGVEPGNIFEETIA
jgi:lipoyl(octanoyl) transferase